MADGNVQCSKEDCDDELDELLDSALEDFGKTAPSVVKQLTTGVTDQETAHKEKCSREIPLDESAAPSSALPGVAQPDFSALFTEGLDGPTVDLENVMKSMLGDDPELMAQFNEFTQATAAAAAEGIPGSLADLESSLSKTLSDMTKNAKDIENCPTGEMPGEEFLRSMAGMNLENSEDFNFMPLMQNMMKNLLSKEVLYPALKDLQEKYPSWLEEKKQSIPEEEFSRHSKQHDLVCKICWEYEAEKPDDTSEVQGKRFEKLMELMQKMQECGHPPAELVGEMPPGLSFDPQAPGPPPEMPEELKNECKMS